MGPGELIDDRFEVEHKAGSGGMGTVYRARDRNHDTPVALKILHGRGETEAERFAREAALLAELLHPGIVRYVAHGRTPGGHYYLAMEWLEGEDLACRLARSGLTVAESVTMFRAVAEALAVAHGRGVVHRDIKPSNIFLRGGAADRVKLVDFGLARRVRDRRAVTRSGTMIGTLDYMAPEQARGARDVDSRADVFSLGCVLYECLTGRAAFTGENETAVLAKILLDDPPRARDVSPELPEALDALIARMLDKDPACRPRDAGSVLVEVTALGEVTGSGVPRQVPRSTAITASEQRVVCLVLAAGPHDAMLARGQIPPTLALGEQQERVAELRAAVAPFRASLEVLADGSVVATLAGGGIATDEAARAARCALVLSDRLPEVHLMLATGRSVLPHVGASSGRLPVGEVIDRSVRALSRRSVEAPMSSLYRIRLDEVTAGLLDARFEVAKDPEGHLALLGERDSIEVARPLLGRPTSCLGRDRELKWLEDLFDECARERSARAVLVTAPAGAGKSRVRQEFLRRLRERREPVQVLFARGDSLSAGAPFGMLGQAIRRTAGIADGEPIEVRRDKLRQRVAVGGEKGRVTAFLGELAAVPFSDEGDLALRAARADAILMGDAMRTAWEDWLIEECATTPVLLVLEDLHHGDLPTVRFVDAALRNLRDRPLMVLALGRPEVTIEFPGLWEERDLQQLRLAPLGRRAAEQLAREALGNEVAEPELARILDRADGNAFYLEELIRAVASGRKDALPDTVLGMVQVRLDALGPAAKRVLRAASIFGDSFRREGLNALLGDGAAAARTSEVGEWLEDLVLREVLSRRGVDYGFRHQLLREAAYAMLTDDDRTLGHRLAGDFLEREGEPRATVLAEHFARGGEPRRAIGWFRRGAEQALEGNDLEATLDRAAQGIACGASGQVSSALASLQAEAHFWRGELPQALRLAASAAVGLTQGSTAWFSAVGLGIIAGGQLGEYDRVAELGRQAVSAKTVDAAAESAQILCICRSAVMLILAGRYAAVDALLAHVGNVVPDFSRLEKSAAAWAYSVFAIRAHQMGEPGTALFGSEAAVGAFEEAGDHRDACLARATLGFGLAEVGQYERAEAELRRALQTAERMGLHNVVAYTHHNLGYVLGHRGQLEQAREIEERAVAFYQESGDPRFEGGSRNYLSFIHHRRGDHALAESEARRAAELLMVAPSSRAVALAALARALLAQGRTAEALAQAQEAVAIRDSLGGIDEQEAQLQLVYAEALEGMGDRAAAREAISVARQRILTRADTILDPAHRESFLADVADNARTLALADAWTMST